MRYFNCMKLLKSIATIENDLKRVKKEISSKHNELIDQEIIKRVLIKPANGTKD